MNLVAYVKISICQLRHMLILIHQIDSIYRYDTESFGKEHTII